MEQETDPLAVDSELLGSSNIEFVVEEDSGNENIVTLDNLNEILSNTNAKSKYSINQLREKLNEENIILYVEDENEENSTIQNEDTSLQNENTNDETEMIDENDDHNKVEQMITDDDDNCKKRNEKFGQQSIKSTKFSDITHFKNSPEKNSFNASFLSFVGKDKAKRIHQKLPNENLENNKSNQQNIFKKNEPERNIKSITTANVSPFPSVLKTNQSNLESKKLIKDEAKPLTTFPGTSTGTTIIPNSSVVYLLGPNNTLTLAQTTPQVGIPGSTSILRPLVGVPPGLQGALPVGVLPASVIQAISQQTSSQKKTLVLMPATPPQVTSTPVRPLINTTPIKMKPTPILPNSIHSFLPVISDVRSVNSTPIRENSNGRQINILSRPKNTNTSLQKANNSNSETVSMMVDGEEILVTAPTNFQTTPKQQSNEKATESNVQLFQITDLQNKTKNKNESVRISQANLCYVPGCMIQKGEKVYLFGVPVDKTLMDLWDASINRLDKRLGNNDIVCEKHFAEEDIVFVKDSQTDTIGGTVKAKPKLKKGAIPCMVYYEECCVPNCRNKNKKMYKFPIFNYPNLQLWLYLLKNPVLKDLSNFELLKHRVCAAHFEKDCFEKNGELLKTAAPTLLLPENIEHLNLSQVGKNVNKNNSIPKSASNLKCLFSGCEKEEYVFPFPSNPEKCNQWLRVCNRLELACPDKVQTDRLLRVLKAGICHEHFDFHDFIGPNTLRQNAVPKSRNLNIQATNHLQPPINSVVSESVDLTCTESPFDSESELQGIDVDCCIYLHCTTKKDTAGVHLFPIPENPPSRFRLWLEACGYKNVGNVEPNGNLKICSKHFTSVMFSTDAGDSLKPHAIPIFSFESVNIDDKSKKNKLYNKTNKLSNENKQPETVLSCAVPSCTQVYAKSSYKAMQHTFPDPEVELERYDLWLKLISNNGLNFQPQNNIITTYMVCERHFEGFFYTDGKTKTGPLASVAVPTLNLPKSIKWFFDTDYYRNAVKDYLKQKVYMGENEIRWLPSEMIDKSEAKGICVLEKDRLNFPGVGYHLYMENNDSSKKKRKYPYDVYKYDKSTYSVMEDIEFGTSLQIHTAIIINDDDEMERTVLQELLDKRKKRMTEVLGSKTSIEET